VKFEILYLPKTLYTSFMLNQERLLQTFLELVQIDSPTGQESAMTQEVARRLRGFGLDPQVDARGNVLAKIPGTGPTLLLNAHLDTVEPGRGIVPLVSGGKIQSQGNTILGADNKVTVALLLEVAAVCMEQDTPHAPLELLFTVSEEVGNEGALAFDVSQLSAKYGFTCDSGDPVGTVTIASPFYNRFSLELQGQAAHASRPEQANSVLPVLAHILSHLPLGRVSDQTVCNVGVVDAGHARNTVPGVVRMEGEVRSFVRQELDQVTNSVIQIARNAARQFGLHIKDEVVMENEGFLFPESDSFVQFTAGVVTDLQLPLQLKRSYECYDANIFNPKGIQMLNLANAVQGMHTVDESISLEDFQNIGRILFTLIQKFSSFGLRRF